MGFLTWIKERWQKVTLVVVIISALSAVEATCSNIPRSKKNKVFTNLVEKCESALKIVPERIR